jgi:hypothetical protein
MNKLFVLAGIAAGMLFAADLGYQPALDAG